MLDLEALEQAAAERLSPTAYDYFRGGADEELTVADNLVAWRRIRLRPYVLRDVSRVSTATTLLGAPVATPVGVAPTAYHALAHPGAEAATVAGAADAGAVFTLSTFSTQPLEDVAAAAPEGVRWFQMYVDPDRGFTAELAARAAAAGYRAIVFTVDVPVLGRRRRDERNAFALPPGLEVAHRPSSASPEASPAAQGAAATGSALMRHAVAHVDPALTVADIGWLASVSGLPVVVKGVLRGDDAVRCLDAGAAAVWVSNHGGRQLDGAIATADALAEVVAAVDGRAEVYVDGGLRTGTSVLRALALGARAAFVGRPVVYGLAAGGPVTPGVGEGTSAGAGPGGRAGVGEGASAGAGPGGRAGVGAVLDGLTEELARAMALCGVTTLDDLTPDLLA